MSVRRRSIPSSSFSDIERLPSDLHGRIFEGLPPSFRFLAPVSRKFHTAYKEYAERNDRHGNTLLYGICTQGQLELLDERGISMVDLYKAAEFGVLDLFWDVEDDLEELKFTVID
mmetsp:Transcript_31575/g.72296  ORF Transcript_31575/g.72296 Transcript_31575/m.72296 type:complete len:115 (-) Transcript_31575:735-1079(-)